MYDIVHSEYKFWVSPKSLTPMELVFLTYKAMIIPWTFIIQQSDHMNGSMIN